MSRTGKALDDRRPAYMTLTVGMWVHITGGKYEGRIGRVLTHSALGARVAIEGLPAWQWPLVVRRRLARADDLVQLERPDEHTIRFWGSAAQTFAHYLRQCGLDVEGWRGGNGRVYEVNVEALPWLVEVLPSIGTTTTFSISAVVNEEGDDNG